jgi:nucleoside-diphosphate-sugar epimerase
MSDAGSEAEDKPKEPEPPQPGKKIFLSHCNSYEGLALFKALWNKDQFAEKPEWLYAAHTFTGTIRKEEKNARGGFEEPPSGINCFVDFERTAEFRSKLLEHDIIIYDLMSNNFDEVDYVIKTLKTSDL